ncbi:hypothetical protein N9E50_03045 [Alphaproteobacteria bacterium]|nr:hypothetical protein [Alphaproteobacteria bacterium]
MKSFNEHLSDIRNNGLKDIFRKSGNVFITYIISPIKKFFLIIYLATRFAIHKKDNFNNFNSNKIIFASVVWGRFNKLYTNFTLPSLLTKNNIPLLIEQGYKIKFVISTIKDINFEKDIRETISKSISIEKIKLEFNYNDSMEATNLNKYLNKIYEQSIIENAIIWPANPDHCYSNGSVSNLLAMMDSDDCCIAAPIFRINEEEFLKNVNEVYDFNKFNVLEKSFEHLHDEWKSSFVNHKQNNSWLTGIVIKEINKYSFLVQSLAQNVFVSKLNHSDLRFFKRKTYNAYDMSWPSKLLVEKRLRIVPSSDVFFASEFTLKNQYTEYKFSKKFNSRNDFKRNLHSSILGSFTYLLKINNSSD